MKNKKQYLITTKLLLLLVGVLLFSASLQAQPRFNKIYPEGQFTYNMVMDGEDIITAAAFYKSGEWGVRWMRIDSSGTLIDQDSIYVAGQNTMTGYYGSLLKKDSSYILIGRTNFTGFLLEVNQDFDTIRHTTYSYKGEITLPFSGAICANGDIVITGENFIPHSVDSIERREVLVARFDEDHNLLWEKSFKAAQPPGLYVQQNGSSIIEMPGGELIVMGVRFIDFHRDSTQLLIIYLDSLGNNIWQKYLGNPDYEDLGIGLAVKTDSSFLVSYGYGIGLRDIGGGTFYTEGKISVSEINLDGDIRWEKRFGPIKVKNAVTNIIPSSRNEFIILGSANEFEVPFQQRDAEIFSYAIKVNSTGDSLWFRRYVAKHSKTDVNILFDGSPTSDGGFAFTGRYMEDVGSVVNQYVWAMRTDSFGCAIEGCQFVSLPEKAASREFDLYPNPASGEVFISVPAHLPQGLIEVRIYDISGREVLSRNISPGEALDVTALNPGLYLVKAAMGGDLVFEEKLAILEE